MVAAIRESLIVAGQAEGLQGHGNAPQPPPAGADPGQNGAAAGAVEDKPQHRDKPQSTPVPSCNAVKAPLDGGATSVEALLQQMVGLSSIACDASVAEYDCYYLAALLDDLSKHGRWQWI